MSRKQGIQRVRWQFTLCNYTEEELLHLNRDVVPLCKYSTWGKEVGANSATPHLQGYVEWKTKKRLTQVRELIPRAHWEVAKGSRADNATYCHKEGDFVEFTEPKKLTLCDQIRAQRLALYDNVVWKPWQQDLVNMVDSGVCDLQDRRIHWYWEYNGNIGKTFVSTYFAAKHNAIIASGKQADVFNEILTLIVEKQISPRCVIVDIPRKSQGYFDVSTLEVIKNGVLYSGKYKGGQVWIPGIHVIVFANCPPVVDDLSLDRWNIVDLNEYDNVSIRDTEEDI